MTSFDQPGIVAAAMQELSTEGRAPEHADLDRRPTVDVVHAVVRGHEQVVAAVDIAAPAIAALADVAAGRMDAGGRVIYVGAGSGGRLALVDAAEWGPTFSEDAVCALVAGADKPPGSIEEAAAEDDADAGAAELRALEPTPADLVIGVTASGSTPYVLGALAAAEAAGALTAVITSALAPRTHFLIEVPVGPEVITGSTRLKAGTAQKLVLNAFSTAVMVRRGRTVGNLMASLRVANDKLRERAVRVCVAATGRPEPEARKALAAADDDVGVAILMLAHGLDAPAARARLDAHGGAIGRAIGLDQSFTTR